MTHLVMLGLDNREDAERVFDLTRFAGQQIRLLVQASDAATASLVEAGVDDVQITVS